MGCFWRCEDSYWHEIEDDQSGDLAGLTDDKCGCKIEDVSDREGQDPDRGEETVLIDSLCAT